jgi:hypothetical protein
LLLREQLPEENAGMLLLITRNARGKTGDRRLNVVDRGSGIDNCGTNRERDLWIVDRLSTIVD